MWLIGHSEGAWIKLLIFPYSKPVYREIIIE